MKQIIYLIVITLFVSSCGFYSFRGASIPTNAKTVSVSYFKTNAPNAPSSLSETITEGLKDLFLSQTNLNLTDRDGDLNFIGEITKFEVTTRTIKENIELIIIYNL